MHIVSVCTGKGWWPPHREWVQQIIRRPGHFNTRFRGGVEHPEKVYLLWKLLDAGAGSVGSDAGKSCDMNLCWVCTSHSEACEHCEGDIEMVAARYGHISAHEPQPATFLVRVGTSRIDRSIPSAATRTHAELSSHHCALHSPA